jgi:hypothetical protein
MRGGRAGWRWRRVGKGTAEGAGTQSNRGTGPCGGKARSLLVPKPANDANSGGVRLAFTRPPRKTQTSRMSPISAIPERRVRLSRACCPKGLGAPSPSRRGRLQMSETCEIGRSTTARCAQRALPLNARKSSYAVYYRTCIGGDRWHVAVCADDLSSFQGSVNPHWNTFTDDLKPDGRERPEITVRHVKEIIVYGPESGFVQI